MLASSLQVCSACTCPLLRARSDMHLRGATAAGGGGYCAASTLEMTRSSDETTRREARREEATAATATTTTAGRREEGNKPRPKCAEESRCIVLPPAACRLLRSCPVAVASRSTHSLALRAPIPILPCPLLTVNAPRDGEAITPTHERPFDRSPWEACAPVDLQRKW